MDRSRSRGSLRTVSYTVGEGAKRKQVMRSSLTNQYVYRETSVAQPVATPSFSDLETISDVIGNFGDANPCVHIKRVPYSVKKQKLASVTGSFGWLSERDWWYTYGWDCGSLLPGNVSFQGLCTSSPGTLPTPNFQAVDWADLTDQVGSQLDGHMLVSQNLLTSFVQIGQTINMVKNPFGILSKLRKHRSQATLSKLLKEPANAYLEYRYGWLNFKRDVEALSNVWAEVRRHRAFLEKTVNKYTSLSSRSTTRMSDVSNFCTFTPIGGNTTGSLLPVLTEVERTASFSLDILRDEASLRLGQMDQVIHRLGGGEVAEALWDLVPWSFVVDWFTHINRFVRQAPILWNSATLRRVCYSVSVKHYGTIQVSSNGYTDFTGWAPTETFCLDPQLVQKSYQRTVGFPPLCSSVGLFGDLNKTQIADGIALLIQRL